VNVNDISIVPDRDGSISILMRQHGDLDHSNVARYFPSEMAKKMIDFLMQRSSANPESARVRDPRDGHIFYKSPSGSAFMRLSFIPLNHPGNDKDLISVSIRLLPNNDTFADLARIKAPDAVARDILQSTKISQGMIIVAGPTNSGKSTTIAASLGEHVRLFKHHKKRLSIEDPIERFVKGVVQINAPQHIDEKERFNIVLKAIKRHDPDVIWVGEIRDAQTSQLAVAASSSGHLVYSTIHANDTLLSIDVLAKMIHPEMRFQLVESLSLILSQRLVKIVCPECGTIETPTDEDADAFALYQDFILDEDQPRRKLPEKIRYAKEGGCPHCEQKGYVGIRPIFESLPMTRKAKNIAHAVMDGDWKARQELSALRTVTLFDHGYDLLSNHITDLSSLLV
jgi:type II secretory ATPase GspE/PulE/Tfp pilus assembly ATPase PilB-like protein